MRAGWSVMDTQPAICICRLARSTFTKNLQAADRNIGLATDRCIATEGSKVSKAVEAGRHELAITIAKGDRIAVVQVRNQQA